MARISNDGAFIETNARRHINTPTIHTLLLLRFTVNVFPLSSVIFFFFLLLFFSLRGIRTVFSILCPSLVYILLLFFIVLFTYIYTYTHTHTPHSNYIIGCLLVVYIYETARGQSVISSCNLIHLHLMTCEKLINLS
jgi:energy-coupling factor transporter transmembrane protein EcfT